MRTILCLGATFISFPFLLLLGLLSFPQTLFFLFLHVFILHILVLHMVPFPVGSFCCGEKNLHVFSGVPSPSACGRGWPSPGSSRRPFAAAERQPVRVRCFPTCSLAFGRGGGSETLINNPAEVIPLHL